MWSRSSLAVAGAVVGGAIALTVIAGCGRAPARIAHPAPPSPGPSHRIRGGLEIGVFEPYAAGSYGQIPVFAKDTGHWPQIVTYYSGWGSPFAARFATKARANGAETMVTLEPRNVSLADIAAGRYDTYLHSYAAQVRRFGHPVIVSFAQEMNGSWYSWGWTQTPPATFVAAWRHIWRLFRSDGVRNVTWLWDVSHQYPRGMAPLRSDWPGRRFVDWVGLDSYLYSPGATYATHIAPDVRRLRRFGKPVVLAETAVGPLTHNVPADIADVFAGARQDHLKALIWFDVAQHGPGRVRQDWRLEGNPVAMAAFKQAVAT
jgi:Glycosyl hydrolase family 26